MGLHTLAKHVQDKGRGNDKLLVHMTQGEVNGLQALAKAHGGSLTINPETGLAEAGFLEQVLPIAAAAAATYFTAGAAAPALEAALAGTMFAGAGGALAGAGAGALVGGTTAALQGQNVGQSAGYGAIGGGIAGGLGAYSGGISAPTGGEAVLNAAPVAPGVAGGLPTALPPVGSADEITMGMAQNANTGMPPTQGPNGTTVMPTPGTTSPPAATANMGGVRAPTTYSGLNDWQKAAILSAPGFGYYLGSNYPTNPSNATAQNFHLATLSPNFKGSTPSNPDPYYTAQYTDYQKHAGGGLMDLAGGGNTPMYPGSQQIPSQYATPSQAPISSSALNASYEPKTNAYTGEMNLASGGDIKKKKRADLTPETNLARTDPYSASVAGLNNLRHAAYLENAPPSQAAMNTLGGIPTAAGGGLAALGGYSDGGQLLKGPGDGVSDNIPATIGNKQPARLADGEFVVPARIVSEIGNGSTDAGAKKLYAMMNRVQNKRRTTKNVATNTKADKYLPA